MIRPIAAAVALVAAPAAVGLGHARADVPVNNPTGIDLDRWTATATGWWAGLDDARALGLGTFAVGLTASALTHPVALSSSTGEDLGAPVARRMTVSLAAAYGVTETVDLDLAMPLVLQTGDRLTAVGDPTALRGATIGDLRIGGKVGVLRGRRIDVAISAHVTLPSGNERHYAGESSWILDWRGLAAASLGPISIGIGAGVRFRGDEVALSPTQVAGNELVGALAIGWTLPPIAGLYCDWTQLRLIAELDGVLGDTVGGERSPSPVEARLGLRGRMWRGWTLGVSGGRGLNDVIGAPDWRGVIELSWRTDPRADGAAPARDLDEDLDEDLEPDLCADGGC